MSRELLIESDVIVNFINFNNKYNMKGIELNPDNIIESPVTTKLSDFFSLELSNRRAKVVLEGIFSFETGDDAVAMEDSNLDVIVNIYNDIERSVLVFSTFQSIAAKESDSFNKKWSLPILILDRPKMRVGDYLVKYFVSIIINQKTGISDKSLALKQYSLMGREI